MFIFFFAETYSPKIVFCREKMPSEDSHNRVSEHQTKLVKENKQVNTDKEISENTINKLRDIVDFLQMKMNFNPAQTHIG